MRVEAAVTRTGVLRYKDASGREWGEYRPPEEVFDAASLATLRSAPVTDLHPPDLVRADSWEALAKGHVDSAPVREGRLVVLDLAVQAAPLVALVRSGDRRECSSGYTCEVDKTPGVSPEGERYDAVQRDIRYNHIALGPKGWGRAGGEVALRMDGAAVEVRAAVPAGSGGPSMKKRTIKIGGKVFRIDGDTPEEDKKMIDEAQAAVEEIEKEDGPDTDAKLEALQTALTDALSQLAMARAEIAAAKAVAPAAPVVTEEMVPEEVLDSAVTKRMTLRADAARVLGADFDFTGKSVAQVRAAVVAKALPSVKLDGLDAKVVEGMYRAAVEGAQAHTRNDALGAANAAANARLDTGADDDLSARLRARTQERSTAPLTSKAS